MSSLLSVAREIRVMDEIDGTLTVNCGPIPDPIVGLPHWSLLDKGSVLHRAYRVESALSHQPFTSVFKGISSQSSGPRTS